MFCSSILNIAQTNSFGRNLDSEMMWSGKLNIFSLLGLLSWLVALRPEKYPWIAAG